MKRLSVEEVEVGTTPGGFNNGPNPARRAQLISRKSRLLVNWTRAPLNVFLLLAFLA